VMGIAGCDQLEGKVYLDCAFDDWTGTLIRNGKKEVRPLGGGGNELIILNEKKGEIVAYGKFPSGENYLRTYPATFNPLIVETREGLKRDGSLIGYRIDRTNLTIQNWTHFIGPNVDAKTETKGKCMVTSSRLPRAVI